MDCTSVFLRISGQEQYVIFMINKENHGEKNFILLNLKQLASVVWWCWWVVCVTQQKTVAFSVYTNTKVCSGCPKHYAFRHQQSHSVAVPNLLFGHNYRGFVRAFRMKKTGGGGGGQSPPNNKD